MRAADLLVPYPGPTNLASPTPQEPAALTAGTRDPLDAVADGGRLPGTATRQGLLGRVVSA